MHHMKLVLNIRLVALLVVAVAVLLAASALAPRQASANYTSPNGVLCFQLTELGGNPLSGIGLVRIDDLGGGNITFTSQVYLGGTGLPTCQQVQDPIPSDSIPSPAAGGPATVLAGIWTAGNHTIVADVCQVDFNFGAFNFAFAKVLVNFVLPVVPTEKLTGTFGIEGPYTDDTCTVQDTGFTSFPVTVISGPFFAGVPLNTDVNDSDWDKDGNSDWQELNPNLTIHQDPFKGDVGGVAELADEAGAPLAAPDSSGSNTGLIAGIVAAIAAGAVTLGGAAWYTRRRSIQ